MILININHRDLEIDLKILFDTKLLDKFDNKPRVFELQYKSSTN